MFSFPGMLCAVESDTVGDAGSPRHCCADALAVTHVVSAPNSMAYREKGIEDTEIEKVQRVARARKRSPVSLYAYAQCMPCNRGSAGGMVVWESHAFEWLRGESVGL